MNVVAGWQEVATEASSEMSQQGSQGERKKRVWGGGADRSNQRESRYLIFRHSILYSTVSLERFCPQNLSPSEVTKTI